MKVLRIILILIGLLALLIIGIGLFGPTGMNVEYKKTLDAPIDSVYGMAQDFEHWQKWSAWKEADPEMKVTFGDITAGTGASYSWTSDQSGNGEMTIREAIPNKELGMDIGIDMGDGMTYSTCDMLFEEKGNQTEVIWKYENSGNDGFFARLQNVIMPAILTGMYEKGLKNLEGLSGDTSIVFRTTKKAKEPIKMGVTEEELPGFYYVGKRYDDVNTTEQYEEMKTMFSEAFGQIMDYLGQSGNGEKMIMPPFSFTHSYDRETTISSFSPAIKVTESIEAGDGLQSDFMKAHKAMVYTHVGSFDNLSSVYEMMVKTLMSKGYTMEFPSYEIYLTDPTTEPDQSKWQTKIVIPVEWME